MPLTLVTGPANSAKAGAVLGGLRARLDEEPILVVPTYADVEHSQRELAERGAVFGALVVRFDWLFEIVAGRAGYLARRASEPQRELLVAEAVRATRLRALAASAGRPGFVRAAARLVAELGRERVDPGALERAAANADLIGSRRERVRETAAVFAGYRERLEKAALVDDELYADRALAALARDPERWGHTPVYVYGFDDFTRLELDALELLAQRCGADVVVSLPYEAGRPAFRAIAGVHEELAAIAAERRVLDPVDEHYAGESRDALHHLERSLFEDAPPPPRAAGAAVRLHAAGGARAEVELAAAEVLRLLRAGTAPGDVAIVFRDPGRYASVVDQVLTAYEIPYSIDHSVQLGHTALGRGLLALLRAAGPGGSADDLLAYLRTPGLLRRPGLADTLEAEVRRRGADDAAAARAVWEEGNPEWPLTELDRVGAESPAGELLEALRDRLERLFAAPWRRAAHVLEGPELEDARAFAAAHAALEELAAIAAADARVRLDRDDILETLTRLRVQVGESAQPDRVQVAAPGAIRARRYEAVFVCGLQEGEFPGGAAPEPFLPDEDRRLIAAAGGPRLAAREDRLDRERYLFYVCASRAERLLVLSRRTSDEEGNPEAGSFFLDDVRDLLDDPDQRRRPLSAVTWDPADAPTAAEYERAVALRGPRRTDRSPEPLRNPAVLAELARRDVVSAAGLEMFADCPVRWLVERLLRPVALEPDPEAMVRGSYAHAVLQRTFARLREETGSRRVTPAVLGDAERILLEEIERGGEQFTISPRRTRARAAVRRLELDMLRFLRNEASDDTAFEPEHLELSFGMPEDRLEEGEEALPPLAIGDLRVRGRIDRVDVSDGMALVRDYKTGRSVDSYKVASWESERRFQAALYLLAVRELLDKRPAGGVYVALGGSDSRPRGLLREGARDAIGSNFVGNDFLGDEEFELTLERVAAAATETAQRMRRGDLAACPDSCAWRGGCSHPSLCRVEE